jgi:hypothetical protein
MLLDRELEMLPVDYQSGVACHLRRDEAFFLKSNKIQAKVHICQRKGKSSYPILCMHAEKTCSCSIRTNLLRDKIYRLIKYRQLQCKQVYLQSRTRIHYSTRFDYSFR